MANRNVNRRGFTKTIAMAGIGSAVLPVMKYEGKPVQNSLKASSPERLKISLNAYSFDKPLRAGTMTIDNLLDFCARIGLDGVDLTGYYFPGYPVVPPDDFIYNVKKKAFRLGLGISGTGIRNDFTWADAGKRAEEKQLVKDWIIVTSKIGAPVMRIFTGNLSQENFSWEERAKWIADDIMECTEFGKKHGVMIGIQNHNDFLKTSSDIEKLMRMVQSDWNGLLLDIGSYHTPDPYKDIAINSKHVISWQLKERMFVNDNQVDTDFSKIIAIARECGYAGYLPFEALGTGDPALLVEALFKKVQTAIKG